MSHKRIGIIGLGVTGGALKGWFDRYTKHEIAVYDPPKNHNDDLIVFKPDAVFVCVPVPTLENGTLDFTIIKSVLKHHKALDRTPFFIRSTVLPKTTDHLRKHLKMRLYAMPEFLLERSPLDSMSEHDIICGVEDDLDCMKRQEELLEALFPLKQIILMSNREAELAKYAHNVFGAIKVNFANLISKYAETIGASYKSVKEGMLMSGFVNDVCLNAPGPDGKFGFGGSCFPKDSIAFAHEAKRLGLQTGSLECMLFENFYYRCLRDHWLRQPVIKYDESYKPKY